MVNESDLSSTSLQEDQFSGSKANETSASSKLGSKVESADISEVDEKVFITK